ncbi:MAG: hypothetical protein OXK80_03260 [Bdellovibrionales bacterium]|nr:hypothetical protein [Bdellovibrionales bacterium]
MDSLAPPLRALLSIKLKIQSGISTRESIREYVKEALDCSFAQDLSLWLFQMESENNEISPKIFTHPFRKMLVEILTQGLEGEQILKSLEILENEMITASHRDLDNQLQKLPFILMMPLLFLQLPAFLLLIFGPLLSKLLSELHY